MHWACWLLAAPLLFTAGYMFHSARVRMMSEREKRELAALKVRTGELQAIIAQVCGLVDKFEHQKSIADIHPRPPLY